jgi:hypothetical protein
MAEERRLSRCSRENSWQGREGCRVALGRTHGRGEKAVALLSGELMAEERRLEAVALLSGELTGGERKLFL